MRITKLLRVNPGAPGNGSDQCDAEIAAYTRVSATFCPGIEPGSTLRWDVSTGDTVVTRSWGVPGAESFQAFTWEF